MSRPLPCPKCQLAYPARGALAAHLLEEHRVARVDALVAARQIEAGLEEEARRAAIASTPVDDDPPSADRDPSMEEPPMPRPCGNCGEVGHGQKVCPMRRAGRRAGKKGKAATNGRPAGAPAPIAAAPGHTNGQAPALTAQLLGEAARYDACAAALRKAAAVLAGEEG